MSHGAEGVNSSVPPSLPPHAVFSQARDTTTMTMVASPSPVAIDDDDHHSADDGDSGMDHHETLLAMPPLPLHTGWSWWVDRRCASAAAAPAAASTQHPSHSSTAPPPRRQTVAEFESSISLLGTVDTVQTFWQWYNNLPAAGSLQQNTTYYLMRAGVRPVWEDDANNAGGHIAVRCSKDVSEDLWLDVALLAVGETLSEAMQHRLGRPHDDVCGVAFSCRRFDNVVQVWNRDQRGVRVDAFATMLDELLPGHDIGEPIYKLHTNTAATAVAQTRGNGGGGGGGGGGRRRVVPHHGAPVKHQRHNGRSVMAST